MNLSKKVTAIALSGAMFFSGLALPHKSEAFGKFVNDSLAKKPILSWFFRARTRMERLDDDIYSGTELSLENKQYYMEQKQLGALAAQTKNHSLQFSMNVATLVGTLVSAVVSIATAFGVLTKIQKWVDSAMNADTSQITTKTSAQVIREFEAILNSKFVGQRSLKKGYLNVACSFMESRKHNLKPNVKNVLVQGKPATGKTAMAEELASFLGGGVIHVNLSLISDPRKPAINQLLFNADGTQTQLYYALSSGNIEGKMFILDEIDKLPIEKQREVLEIFVRHSGNSGTIAGVKCQNCIIAILMNKNVDKFFADLNDTSWRSRINNIVKAEDLSKTEYMSLIHLKIDRLLREWEKEYKVKMDLSEEAISKMADILMEDGYSVRDIEGKFSQELSNDIVHYMLDCDIAGITLPESLRIDYDAENSEFKFNAVENPVETPTQPVAVLA